MVARQDVFASQEWLHRLDLQIPADTAPSDAHAAIDVARGLGVRSVCVTPTFVNAVRRALPRTCQFATWCSQVAGWPGDSLLLHVGQQLAGRDVDELDIPVDVSLLGDAAWVSGQLRRVAAVCHAHGALANVVVIVDGLASARLREVVRGVGRTTVNSVTLVSGQGAMPAGLVAAALDEAAGKMEVRIGPWPCDAADLARMRDLGVSSVGITVGQLVALGRSLAARAVA